MLKDARVLWKEDGARLLLKRRKCRVMRILADRYAACSEGLKTTLAEGERREQKTPLHLQLRGGGGLEPMTVEGVERMAQVTPAPRFNQLMSWEFVILLLVGDTRLSSSVTGTGSLGGRGKSVRPPPALLLSVLSSA